MSNPKDYNEPWMNNKLLRLWKKKYFAWKRYTERKGYQRYREYKQETEKLKRQSRKAKRAYERKIAKGARHNKRAFFRRKDLKLKYFEPKIQASFNPIKEFRFMDYIFPLDSSLLEDGNKNYTSLFFSFDNIKRTLQTVNDLKKQTL